MPICKFCGEEFELSDARIYNEYYPNGDVCESCAVEEISCDYATGAEIKELMGTSWDDD